MADEVIEASVWGVNERGEIVAATGKGTSNVAGYISESQIPQNDQGKVVFANVPTLTYDASGSPQGFSGPSGAFLFGPMISGMWMKVPSLFRLRLTGTGSCVIDSRNRLGVVTNAIATYSPSGATNQIEYPYPGEDAAEIRATLTGTTTVEVI